MSQEQAERAIQQLYADSNTRDELIDEEAEVLLKWGEEQINALAAQGLDDAAFDEAYAHLRRVMTNVNRFTGKRTYATPEELKTYLDQMANEAQALGVDVTASQLDAPGAQAADDNIALIQSLTSMVSLEGISAQSAIEPVTNAQENSDSAPSTTIPVDMPDTTETALPPLEASPPADGEPESEDDKGLLGRLGDLF